MVDAGSVPAGEPVPGAASAPAPDYSRGEVSDLLVRLFVASWFLLQAANFLRAIIGMLPPAGWLELDTLGAARIGAKICIFFFFVTMGVLTLVRVRPIAKAEGWQPRVTALLGTYLLYAMLFLPTREDLGVGLHLLSAALVAAGNTLALIVISRLGRSFSINAEARQLVTGGPYALVRHPLYLAEQVGLLGVFIEFASWPAAALMVAQFAFQFQRMRNEEAILLASFPDYRAYMDRTARLIPGIW
jgi:protein-S-isoprenylcysteine O-methyltransferase Ste14